ncbi:hypothetical protein [Fontivita pretiosa]|uniref:hypothetical protein n=1 Tax=Fontivita pretiosa TaxID=2989684 RepID=UPI003D170010
MESACLRHPQWCCAASGGRACCERLEVKLHLDSPTVTSSQFLWKELPQRHVVEFNQDVSGVGADDFEVVNLDTDQPEPVVYEGYDALTHKATLRFPGVFEGSGMLASGNYQLRIRPGAVSSAATGEPMLAAHEAEFFFLWGDADHNRVVDATDYAILDNSYVNQARTFPELSYYENGDFDYSTTWDSTDYSLIDAGFMIHLVEPTDFYVVARSLLDDPNIGIRVSWDADPAVHQWRVERNSYDGNGYVPITGWIDAAITYLDDAGLVDGKWYGYRVRGRDINQNLVAYTPHRGDYTVLAAASDVQAEELSPSSARVTWTDNSASEDGFYVLMSSDGGQTWSTVATLGANQTSYDATVTGQMSELLRVQTFGGDPTAPLLKAGMGPSTRISLKVPAIMEPASANPNPVTGTTANLSVLGSTARGESYLTYTWSVASKPADAPEPIFSINGSNAAKNSSVTFLGYGAYRFIVTIANEYSTVSSSVDVTVIQTLTSISVGPGFVELGYGGTQQFTARAVDQFGESLVTQPSISWSLDAGSLGTLSDGVYTAPMSGGGSAVVRATAGSASGSALVQLPAWELYGEASFESITGALTVGVPDRSHRDSQDIGVHGASLRLFSPEPDGYTVEFSHALYTWDSYVEAPGQEGTGYWDSFSVSVTDRRYPDLELTDPVNFPFVWGGSNYSDGNLEHTSGTNITLTFAGTLGGENFLNFVLDTKTPDGADGAYPSWGTYEFDYELPKPDLDVDSNNNGTIDDSDDSFEDTLTRPGVIIALNDDDDDDNGVPDWQQSGVVSGEDDLVPMNVGSGPGPSRILRIVSGASRVRVWSDPQRSGTPLLGLGATREELRWPASWPDTLWIEGVKPSATTGGVRFVLAASPSTDPTATQPITVDAVRATVRKFSVKWVPVNTATVKTALDDNPHLNGGRRIIPDKDTPADTVAHDLIDVEATITPPPPAGTTIYFQSYDVDDPNAFVPGQPQQQQIDKNDTATAALGLDNRGTVPGQRGTFPAAGINYRTSATTDAAGKATVRFQVTMQPGDNFRIAAALTGPELDAINDNTVPPNNKQVPGFKGAVTDMLTVWRRLWIERDAMGTVAAPVVANTVAVTITGITRNVAVAGGFNDIVQLAAPLPDSENSFEGGRLSVGTTQAPIYLNSDNIRAGDTVNVPAGIIAPMAFPAAATVTDDDVIPATGTMHLPDGGSLLESAFGVAYILPRYVDPGPGSINTVGNIPFARHLEDGDNLVSAKNLPASTALFWTMYLVGAFENFASTDGDADGIAPTGLGVPPIPGPTIDSGLDYGASDADTSFIFLETIDDFVRQRNYSTDEWHTVTHEIGHTVGTGDGTHSITGIMRAGAPKIETVFDNYYLNEFRTVLIW